MGMKDMEKYGLDAFEKTMDVNVLKWYLYDIINEVMEKDGVGEKDYFLNGEREGAVCILIKEGIWHVCGRNGEDSKSYNNFYHAVCDFFNRVYRDEDKTEEAVSRFLTRTLDMPVMIKKPSLSMLKDNIHKCQEKIGILEEKLQKEPGKMEEAKLSLERIYLKGQQEKLKKNFSKNE
jgi:hypothetical protein